MQCLIRLDDITPDMDWKRFYKIKDILEQAEIVPLIGVVPSCKDQTIKRNEPRKDFWDIIKALQQKGWKIAQHGTYHVYVTNNSGILGINPFSEFAGLSFEEQLLKIKTGRDILKSYDIHTDIFMAPGHTFDKNTLAALKQCGFHVITDGLYKKPYYFKELLFIPCKMIGNYRINGIDTICLHTNLMSEEDMFKFSKFIEQHRNEIINFTLENYKNIANKKGLFISIYEKVFLWKRIQKDKIAHSKKISWYLEWTNHGNNFVKWGKRILFFPIIFLKNR